MPSAARTESDKVNGPRSRKGVQTRARLVDAAKQIFEENGFLDARISDIAERAGLSHGSFYHYFESKEQVFREVAEALEEELSAPLGDVILARASKVPPRDRIREGIRRHFESYQAEARMMGVIEQVSRYDDYVHDLRLQRSRIYTSQIAESIRQLQQRGMADTKLDPAITAAALGAMTYRFAELWLVQGALDCTLDEVVDQLSRLFANAMGLEDEPVSGAARVRRRAAP